MTLFSVKIRDRIFVEGYEFLFFVKNMGRNIGKNVSGKYSQNLFIMLKNLLQMHLKLNLKK